ncbi:MAG: PAS domain S-box protein [Deltaproteobacteria bacterium]|nr:PAS domain S-box protein [Candidatus Desulfobacula maris]
MNIKPTYEELKQRVRDLEDKLLEFNHSLEEFHRSQEYLEKLISYTNAPIIVWDPTTRITLFNPAFEHLTDYTAKEILGKKLKMLFPESSRDELLIKIENALSGEYWDSVEIPVFHKNGNVLTILWNSSNIYAKDGMTVLFTIAQGYDITKRKQAEEALKESEEQYRSMMEAMDDATYICSSDFRIEYMNPAMIKRTGYDATGESCHKVMHGLEEKCPWCTHEKVMKGEHITYEVVSPKDNRTYLVSNSLIVHTDESVSKLTIFHDITEFKKMELHIQRTQRIESLGILAGGIAHDFNNILFPVIGHTEMLLDDVPEDSPFRNSLNEIYTNALRARDLVKQILTFSNQDTVELKLMKMQPVVKEALKLIRSTIPTTIDIKQDINADCGLIKADPIQIYQIVMNLLTNAYHAMEDTGGEMKVSLKKIELGKLDLIDPDMEPGTYACLIVADKGMGMNKELIGKIFDPYFSTKKQYKGTGMGLSFVHSIVKSMKGGIQVFSKPGKGTRFHVYLPVVKSSSEQQVIQTKKPVQGGTEQILIVDDEKAIIKMGKNQLERLGYQVTSYTSSLEALDAFRANPDKFDLIITDMAMPNMSGNKLSAELIKIRPNIPILLCTGFSEIISEKKAASLGIKGFILKPIGTKDLAKKIREVLGKN